MIPSSTDIQKSSGDHLSTAKTKQLSKVEEISPIKTETTTSAETRERSSTVPGKKKQKSDKKASLLPSIFGQSEKITKVPALDLPAVERDLSPNNPTRPPHRHDSDPFRVPAVDLPKLDLPLPAYDRPEVNMTTGQIKQTSEFAIPTVSFSPIPNLKLPENSNQPAVISSKEMKVPNVQLPNLQYTSTTEKTVQLPEIERKTKSEVFSTRPTTAVETSHVKTGSPTSTVKTQVIKTISPSPEQQITVIETHVVQSSNVPTSIEVGSLFSPFQLSFTISSRKPIPIFHFHHRNQF